MSFLLPAYLARSWATRDADPHVQMSNILVYPDGASDPQIASCGYSVFNVQSSANLRVYMNTTWIGGQDILVVVTVDLPSGGTQAFQKQLFVAQGISNYFPFDNLPPGRYSIVATGLASGGDSNNCNLVVQTAQGVPTGQGGLAVVASHLACAGPPNDRYCQRVQGAGPDECGAEGARCPPLTPSPTSPAATVATNKSPPPPPSDQTCLFGTCAPAWQWALGALGALAIIGGGLYVALGNQEEQ